MVRLLYIMSIVASILGFGGITLAEAPLSVDNASMVVARVAIVMAYVLIPYFIARALEHVSASIQSKRQKDSPELDHHRIFMPQASQSGESYFDYFFLPSSSREWPVMPSNPKRSS